MVFTITPSQIISYLSIFTYDIGLTLLNTVSSKRPEGKVTPEGHPGFEGKWPEFIPTKEGDSRCSCPALNALANHGILARDGKGITFAELPEKLRTTYNFSPSFSLLLPTFAANTLKKKYKTDTFDLSEVDVHNGIEHDASLLRRDLHFQPDQSIIHVPYVEELLDSATAKDQDGNLVLTIPDLSKMSSKRRAESRAENPEFSLDKFHAMFGSSNSAALLTAFGGRVDDLRAFLLEERLPEGWESRVREAKGLTVMTFNKTVKKIEKGINEEPFAKPAVAPSEAGPAVELSTKANEQAPVLSETAAVTA